VGPDDTEITPPASNCQQSVDPEVAAGMEYAMQCVLTQGSATQSNGNTYPKVPMIGKTGTTDDAQDTWMSGASTKVATVVGVVNVTGDQNQRDTYFDSGSAATARHRMWPDIMSVANAKYGGDDFPDASTSAIYGAQVTVPDVRGQSPDAASVILENEGFTVVTGGEVNSELPAGTVASTNPANGASVSSGATVTLSISNGKQTLLPDVVGQTLAQAEDLLDGYTVQSTERAVTDASQDGKVISMSPTSGTAATEGSTVNLVVGKLGASNGNGNNNDTNEDNQ
jgi:membrane peptidoglycan carboxypeptidase